MIDHQRVARSFHAGAADYDGHTPVQQRVVIRLLEQLQQQEVVEPQQILDIGCGTGLLLEQLGNQYQQAALHGLDLAPNMLQQAAQRLMPTVCLIQGDAEQLPFVESHFDLVVSSSTFQWLDPLDTCFREVQRVLKPNGLFRFALFGAGTLGELHQSWRDALVRCGRTLPDTQDGTHTFHTLDTVSSTLERQRFKDIEVEAVQEVVWYDSLPRLLQAIKRIGAGTVRPPAGGGLGWRPVMHAMAAIYQERFGTADGVPASYQVIYGTGRR